MWNWNIVENFTAKPASRISGRDQIVAAGIKKSREVFKLQQDLNHVQAYLYKFDFKPHSHWS